MEDYRRNLDYLAMKKPHEMKKIIRELEKYDPEYVVHMVNHLAKGDHLTTKEDYHHCVEGLEWADKKGAGEKWMFEDIIRKADKILAIDFDKEEYTEYDFAFVVNMLYAIFCRVFSEELSFFKMAKELLNYSKINETEHYGDFFKPIEKHKRKTEQEMRERHNVHYPQNEYYYRKTRYEDDDRHYDRKTKYEDRY